VATAQETSRQLTDLATRAARLSATHTHTAPHTAAALSLAESIGALSAAMIAAPLTAWTRQLEYWDGISRLWQHTTARTLGLPTAPAIAPDPSDRRFRNARWSEELSADVLKQSYLLASRYLLGLVEDAEMDAGKKQRLAFWTRQQISALAPSNFPLTNPVVVDEIMKTGGQNLLDGLDNLLTDVEQGRERLRLRMSEGSAFTVGHDIATTPGRVVSQTGLMQLIQYAPSTEKVARRPLLIVPPWINKYYILDLRPDNSFIRWAVAQGHTVFVVSWVNPDERHADKGFEDYMLEGPLAAMDTMARLTGERELNLIGYCIGGTLTAAMLSYLAKKGDDRVQSATFFTTLTDFEDAGEIKVFIDERQIAELEGRMDARGFLPGSMMGDSFRFLRENDLIWNYVVDQYLLGRQPAPLDLLHWNEDGTNMPAKMHSFYLRNMYLENNLVRPGGITLGGVPIDLRDVTVPTCIVSAERDHVAPWKSTYKATQLYQGPTTFMLGGSGHVAGVVNPPSHNRYGYRVTNDTDNPADPDAWYAASEQRTGSWWTGWQDWVRAHSGGEVDAHQPTEGIEAAPGSYATTAGA
jgi:polyhydroxyalkanoate synthase